MAKVGGRGDPTEAQSEKGSGEHGEPACWASFVFLTRDAGNLDFISSVLIFKKHRVCQELPCWPQLTVIILWPMFPAVTFISKYFAVCGLGRMSHGMSRKVPRLQKSRLTPLEVLFPKVRPRGLRSSAECPPLGL